MVEPLTRWTCDICAQDVPAAHGLLTFRNQSEDQFLGYDFRIVHSRCSVGSDATAEDVLSNYLGADGLGSLLAFLSAGPGRPGEQGLAVRDIDEFVDVIRRLHTPFYEQARIRFSDPLIRARMRADDRWRPYHSANLRAIADSARQARRSRQHPS